MKTYKTWEMIKELTENPSKKFEAENETNKVGYNFKAYVVNNRLEVTCNDFLQALIDTGLKWEEVNKPVTFWEAVKSGKKVKVEHPDINGEINYLSTNFNELDVVLELITGCFASGGIREILTEGEWYIED